MAALAHAHPLTALMTPPAMIKAILLCLALVLALPVQAAETAVDGIALNFATPPGYVDSTAQTAAQLQPSYASIGQKVLKTYHKADAPGEYCYIVIHNDMLRARVSREQFASLAAQTDREVQAQLAATSQKVNELVQARTGNNKLNLSGGEILERELAEGRYSFAHVIRLAEQGGTALDIVCNSTLLHVGGTMLNVYSYSVLDNGTLQEHVDRARQQAMTFVDMLKEANPTTAEAEERTASPWGWAAGALLAVVLTAFGWRVARRRRQA